MTWSIQQGNGHVNNSSPDLAPLSSAARLQSQKAAAATTSNQKRRRRPIAEAMRFLGRGSCDQDDFSTTTATEDVTLRSTPPSSMEMVQMASFGEEDEEHRARESSFKVEKAPAGVVQS